MATTVWWPGLSIDYDIEVLKTLSAANKKWREVALEAVKTQAPSDEHGAADTLDIISSTYRMLFANLAVATNSTVEKYATEMCARLAIPVSGKGVPAMWKALTAKLGINIASMPEYDLADKARLMGNAFKHGMPGTKNKTYVKRFGGIVGEEIVYEQEDWDAIFTNVRMVLREAKRRDPSQQATDHDLL